MLSYRARGPPGIGRTELPIWWAGEIRFPSYRLSLNGARLSDQIFAQLVLPTNLRHDNADIQPDRRISRKACPLEIRRPRKVFADGDFFEVLQGSNAIPEVSLSCRARKSFWRCVLLPLVPLWFCSDLLEQCHRFIQCTCGPARLKLRGAGMS